MRFARMPVYEKSLDDIFGVVYAQDLLHIADQDLPKRKVRELVRPALFMPETKAGSELLREMRQKDQPMAIIIDEHGLSLIHIWAPRSSHRCVIRHERSATRLGAYRRERNRVTRTSAPCRRGALGGFFQYEVSP